MAERDEDALLRAKYMDYCSARIADALLALSPDEIFTLAESEARTADQVAPSSYREAIRLATARIRGRLRLPEYSEWVEAYSRDPDQFAPYLMGLWKTKGDDHL